MGHYEPEWEDYNPVTDKWTRGPMHYVVDEKDRQEAYEKRSRADEFSTIKSYIESIEDGYDYAAISKVGRKIDEARYLDAYQKSDLRRDLNYHVELMKSIEQNKRNAEYEKSRKNLESLREKSNAYNAARKRYKSLSLFKKIKNFKQRPNKINYTEATVEELDQLYRRR